MGCLKSDQYTKASEKSLTRERMIYLQEIRQLGYVPTLMDFLDYAPLHQLEKDWDHFMQSSLAHKLRSIGLNKTEVHAILFDTFCEEYLLKY